MRSCRPSVCSSIWQPARSVRVSKVVVQSTLFLPLALAIPALIGLMIGIGQVDHPRALVR